MAEQESTPSEKQKIPWSKVGTIIGGLAFVGMILFFIIPRYIDREYTQLEFLQFSMTRLLSFNKEIQGLKILLNDENISDSSQNITLFYVRIRNSGTIPVLKEYFDNRTKYGIEIGNGKLISTPELVRSSDSLYYTDVFSEVEDHRLIFECFIYNPDEYFDIGFFVLHKNGDTPTLKSFGKLANQSEIKLISAYMADNKRNIGIDDLIAAIIVSIFITAVICRVIKLAINDRKVKVIKEKIARQAEIVELLERIKSE